MVALNPPFSTAAVDVPEGLVDRYVADGWKRQVAEEPEVEHLEETEPLEVVEVETPAEAEVVEEIEVPETVEIQKRRPGRPKKTEDE